MTGKKLSKIFISFLAAVSFLSLGELGLRLFWEMAPSVRRPFYQRSKNPYIRYELIPGAVSANIKINSAGFRGSEITIEKQEGAYRILMLGDSELFSILLPEEDNLSRQLEKLLNEKSGGLKFEVVNTGVEGYNTYQEFEVLKDKGLKYAPDLVVLNYVLNDPEPGEYYFGNNFLSRNSALYRYCIYRVKKGLIKRERKRLKIKTEPDHFNYLHSGESFLHLKNTILEMAAMLEERKIRLVVHIFPVSSLAVNDFKENYPYSHLHQMIKDITHKNIICVDAIEEFNRLEMTPQEVSINYQYNESHKNALALGVMAELLCRVFRENNLISGI
ncbi:MAG: hypothetical protein AABZ65_03755 [Candidatus Omnitrophota bacterium]